MPGYDEWKRSEPVSERELEAERAAYAAERAQDETPVPKYKLAVWFERTLGLSCARFSVHYPGDRGWIALNDAVVDGDDMPGALRCLRAARRLFA